MDQALMPTQIEIASPRLRLVALDPRLAALQVDDRQAFFDALEVEPEPSWPPELTDETAMRRLRPSVSHRVYPV